MSFPQFRAASIGAVSGTSATAAAPAGTTATDYQLVAVIFSSGSMNLGTVSPGWTALTPAAGVTVTSASSPDRGGTNKIFLYEIASNATAAQRTGDFTITSSASGQILAVRLPYSLPAGSAGRTVPYAQTVEPNGSPLQAHPTPPVNTTAPDSVVVAFGLQDWPSTAGTWVDAGTWNLRANATQGTGNPFVSILAADTQVATPTNGVSGIFNAANADEIGLFAVVIDGVSSSGPPTVNAGGNASITVNTQFDRTATATDNGSPITDQGWEITAAPGGVTLGRIDSDLSLSWVPTVVGSYTLRAFATNGFGTGESIITVTVTAPSPGTLDYTWVGIDSLLTKMSGYGSGAQQKVAFSTSSNMASPVYTALQTPDSRGITRHSLTGLVPGTTYWYQVESAGTLIGTPQQFKTLPGTGPTNFSFGFSSCRHHSNNSPSPNPAALASAQARNIDFFLEIGDLHYLDISANDQAAFHAGYDEVFTRSNFVNLLKAVPTGYVWDDHDFGGDGSNGGSPAGPAAQTVYRQRVPHPALPHSNGIYHTFVVGRVRVIMLDCRSFRSPNGNTDNSSKTMLGSTQKTWLKDLLDNANTPYTVIVSSVGWVGGTESAQDHWGNYQTERNEIGGWITANTAKTKVVFISGDAHMLAIDDGSNAVAGTPQYHAAALNQTGSVKGGPYSHGTLQGGNQYGIISVTDDGSNISVTYSGYRSDNTLWNSHTTSVFAPSFEAGRFFLAY